VRSHPADRPDAFTPGLAIVAAGHRIEALGTVFQVRLLADGGVGVRLSEGQLRITPAQRAPALVEAPADLVLSPWGSLLPAAPARSEVARKPSPAPAGPAVGSPLSRIRRLLANREIDTATRELQAFLQTHRDDPQGSLLLGDAHRLAGRHTQAEAQYRRVAGSGDAHLSEAAWFELGLLQLGPLARPGEALETFQTIRRSFPEGLLRQEVAFQVAQCFLALKDFQRATRALQDYLRLYPDGTKAAEVQELLQELSRKGWR